MHTVSGQPYLNQMPPQPHRHPLDGVDGIQGASALQQMQHMHVLPSR
jgi:hypothetical protein